jgi:hypothetical protein
MTEWDLHGPHQLKLIEGAVVETTEAVPVSVIDAPALIAPTVVGKGSPTSIRPERSLGVHLRPGMRRNRGAWGRSGGPCYEGSLIDCPRGGARGRKRLGDHEQGLQERPSFMGSKCPLLGKPSPERGRALVTISWASRGAGCWTSENTVCRDRTGNLIYIKGRT